jgi:hypothetical protein
MRKILAAILTLMMLAVLLPSCTADVAKADTNFRLLVSDEPNDIGDFYSVNVTVSEIGILSADTDNWTTYDVNRTFDLVKLTGDNATEIWGGLIASGNYTKVFIYVDNVTGILKKAVNQNLPGDNATIKLPSGKLQISIPFMVTKTGDNSTVDFVFDITIIKAGNSGKYILKPQIGESGPDQPYNDITPKGEKNRNDKNNNGKSENQGNVPGNRGKNK